MVAQDAQRRQPALRKVSEHVPELPELGLAARMAVGEEVTGEDEDVRPERRDRLQASDQVLVAHPGSDMKVADLHEPGSGEGGRQACHREIPLHDRHPMGLDLEGVGHDSGGAKAGGGAPAEEISAGHERCTEPGFGASKKDSQTFSDFLSKKRAQRQLYIEEATNLLQPEFRSGHIPPAAPLFFLPPSQYDLPVPGKGGRLFRSRNGAPAGFRRFAGCFRRAAGCFRRYAGSSGVNPDGSSGPPDASGLNRDGSSEPPDVSGLNPDGSSEPPDVSDLNRDVSSEPPDVSSLNQDGSSETPDVSDLNRDGSGETPDVSDLNPDGSGETPDVSGLNQDVSSEPPRPRFYSSDTWAVPPGTTVAVPVQVRPSVAVTSTFQAPGGRRSNL
jgi:hypothetical protein